MKTKNLIILSCLCLSPLTGFSAEIDAFSKRFEPLEDSLVKVNQLTNRLLQESLDEVNSKRDGCDQKHLYKSLRKRFNNQYQGELAKEIINSDEYPKIKIPSKESIYQDFKWYEAIVQGGTSRISDPIADQMKINGILVGTDKFEHFMGSGYKYFNEFRLEKHSVEEALQIGWKAETGILGAVTTGVMSYADLTANFNGMRFWNHMLQLRPDILGDNHGPYISCQDNQFVQVKKIDFRHYIDESMDESINCSKFARKKSAKKFLKRVEALGYSCPMDPDKLEMMKEKYGEFSKWIINDEGVEDVSYFNEF